MKKLCTVCGETGTPVLSKKGSTGVAVILWLLWLLPGIIYSIWRANSEHEVCASCGSPQIIPLESVMAKKFLGPEFYEKEEHQKRELLAQQKAQEEEIAAREKTEQARIAAQPFIVRHALEGIVALFILFIVCFVFWAAAQPPAPAQTKQLSPNTAAASSSAPR